MRKIAVLTSGGDSPGMNAAVRAVVRTAVHLRLEVTGVRRGYAGLMEGDFLPLPTTAVSGIINRGGTILLTARSEPFKTPAGQEQAVRQLQQAGIEGLVVIGGDGSFHGAHELYHDWHVPTVGVPASIDNDLAGTDLSIGFDTAVNTALESIDRIRDTAVSHDRIFVVEVMGRESGMLALYAGVAGGAEVILIPEVPTQITQVGTLIKEGIARGKRSYIIVVAEGAARGIAVAADIEAITGAETRATVLGHVPRGGSPSMQDRVLASRLGAEAAHLLAQDRGGLMIGVQGDQVVASPLETAWTEKKPIDLSLYQMAQVLAT